MYQRPRPEAYSGREREKNTARYQRSENIDQWARARNPHVMLPCPPFSGQCSASSHGLETILR